MSDDGLERLASQGRRLIAEDHAREERGGPLPMPGVERARGRRIQNSLSSFSRWVWLVASILVGACAVLAVASVVPPSAGGDREARSVLALVAAVGPAVLLYLLRPFVGGRAVAREEARVRGLPFKVHGYLDALGGATTEGVAAITIRFTDAVTTESPNASFRTPGARRSSGASIQDGTLDALFRSAGGRVERGGERGSKRIVYTATFETSTSHNAHLATWLRRAMRVLELLHAEHPIDDVRVDGFA